jgi:parallel beta-helix repeat protein
VASNGGAGIYGVSSTPTITNCTITGNSAGNGGGILSYSSSPTINNSIIWGNTASSAGNQFYNSGSTTMLNYSCYANETGDIYNDATFNPDEHCINTNPKFIDPNNDFRILETSPCADSGNDVYTSLTTDIRGTGFERKLLKTNSSINGPIDIGAYEFKKGIDDIITELPRIYVKSNATGSNSGTSWTNAFTSLQSALITAISNCEIWVAAGTYKPTSGSDRNISFQLKNGVAIYGGFAGTETTLDQRNYFANVTILSGDLNDDDVVTRNGSTLSITGNSENSYHVIFNSLVDNSALLDGFTIKGGNADGSSNYGGGVYNYFSIPTLNNCTIQGNSATGIGGGIYNDDLSPTFKNCIIQNNNAEKGGGIANNSSSAQLTNCLIVFNSSSDTGGGMYSLGGSPLLTNCTITENFSANSGGGMSFTSSSPTIYNSIICRNISSTNWSNQIHSYLYSNVILNYSCYSNDYRDIGSDGHGRYSPDANCIHSNPQFVNPTNDFRLTEASPCIDAGNESYNIETTDIRRFGFSRKLLKSNAATTGPIDMGAYEYKKGTDAEASGPLRIYVKRDASGADNGTNWANAYTSLQTALTNATPFYEIWVAAGTYKPTTGTDIYVSFSLKDHITIYGGFAGNETSIDQRNWVINETILSGDLNNDDSITGSGATLSINNNYDNSNYVINNFYVGNTSVLDGFTIKGGRAPSGQNGGGINNISSPIQLNNCIIKENSAYYFGGGMYNQGASPIVTNCVFLKNHAYAGGGFYNNSGTPILNNCTFSDNFASSYGGGINGGSLFNCSIVNNYTSGGGGGYVSFGESNTVTNCSISGNIALNGAGLYLVTGSSAQFFNCIISGNHGSNSGGGVFVDSGSSPILNNCTITKNSSANGGGIYFESGTESYIPVLNNSIIWGNTGATIGNEIYIGSRSVSFNNSCYQNSTLDVYNDGTLTTVNCITEDPLFLDSNNDFRINESSPCADAGNDTYNSLTTDIRGEGFGRKLLKTNSALVGPIDIGAYEFKSDTYFRNPTNGGTIAGLEAICYGSEHPGITSTLLPTGYEGTLEYKWQQSTTGNSTGFTDISSSNDTTYLPYDLTTTTWFKRLSRVTQTTNWDGAAQSNILKINVDPVTEGGSIEGPDKVCSGNNHTTLTLSDHIGNVIMWQSSVDYWLTPIDISNTSTNLTATNLTVTTKYRAVVQSGVCTPEYSTDATVTVNPLPSADAGDDRTICSGSNTQIGATTIAGSTYRWTSLPAGFTSDSANPTVTPTETTTYIVTETITETGCTNTNSVTVTVNPLPSADAGNNRAICAVSNTQIGATAVAGSTYSWTSLPAGFTSTLANPTVTPTETTTYTLVETITETGCTNTHDVTVTVNPLPAADAGTDRAICAGSNTQIGATAVAGSTYSWTSLPAGFTSDSANPTVTPTETTTYTITETITETGCTNIDSVRVTVINTRLYVTTSGAGLKDGTSWSNAYDNTQIQTAIDEKGVSEVWVAAGTYKPTTGIDRTVSFQMKNGVAIYGGFAGTESSLNERNWTTNVTVLSGDIGTPGDSSDNSYHVVYNSNVIDMATIDGFTIQGGYNDSEFNGGGIYNETSVITLANCTISRNFAQFHGGGIYNSSSSPTLTNCTISGNSSQYYGGGIKNHASSPTMINCLIINNSAQNGGGIDNDYSYPTLTNCTISGNFAQDYGVGGGINNYVSSPTLTNCLIINNSAQNGGGGGIYDSDNSSPTLTNCTISGNLGSYGGGLAIGYSSSTILNNSIIWGNSAIISGNQMDISTGTNVTLNYSCYGNGPGDIYNDDGTFTPDANCITSDPKFINPNNDFRIADASPCTDAGNDAFNPESTDIRGTGFGRKLLKTNAALVGPIDIGAYEYEKGSDPETPDILRIYVNGVVTGGANNGTSWTNAYSSLQDALTAAGSHYEIWVAAGIYTPTTGTDRTISFNMKNDLAIYGGFAGSETSLSERNWTTNKSILSGDIGSPGDSVDNSYHVVYNRNVIGMAIIDGFIIQGGYNDNWANGGGGVYNEASAITLANCIISGNYALYCGGGILNEVSSPTLINCTISGNSGQFGGGGIGNLSSSLTMTNCLIVNNSAQDGDGGGIYDYNSSPNLTNCTISENVAQYFGGGLYYYFSSPTLTNCLVVNNSAQNAEGGGIYDFNYSSSTLNNCTISGNLGSSGGGLSTGNSSSTILNNSIIWGNSATNSGNQMYINAGTTVTLNYSCYGNGPGDVYNDGTFTPDANCITSNPKFVNPVNDFRIINTSPCADAGNDGYNSEVTDIRGSGFSRKLLKTDHTLTGPIDLGTYEFNEGTDPEPPVLVATSPAYDCINSPRVYQILPADPNGFVRADLTMTFMDNTIGNGGQPMNVAPGDSTKMIRIFEYTYDESTEQYLSKLWKSLPVTDPSISFVGNVVTVNDIMLRDGINGVGPNPAIDNVYYVTVDNGAVTNGNPDNMAYWSGIDNASVWRFQTGNDDTFIGSANIISPNIADDGADAQNLTIAAARNLIVEFGEGIEALPHPTGKVQVFIVGQSTPVEEKTVIQSMISGKRLSLTLSNLVDETNYYIQIQAYAFGDTSKVSTPNLAFGGLGVWEFQTGDNTAPLAVTKTPNAGCIGSNPTLQMTFSESRGVVKGISNLVVSDPEGNTIAEVAAEDVFISEDGNTVTAMVAGLPDTTLLKVSVPAMFIFDGDPHSPLPNAAFSWTFSTGENTVPFVVGITPDEVVSPDTVLAITFSEVVIPVVGKVVTIDGVAVAVEDFTTTDYITYILPLTDLTSEKIYIVDIEAGAFVDVNANCVPNELAETTESFVTGDFTNPVVSVPTTTAMNDGSAAPIAITSSKAGTVYLAREDVAANKAAMIAAIALKKAVTATLTAPGSINVDVAGLVAGIYKAYAFDASGRMGIAANVVKVITIQDNLSLSDIKLTYGQSDCYNAFDTITVAGGTTTVVFQNGSIADLIAGQAIIFLPGFHAESGSNVHASITTTGSFCDGRSSSIVLNPQSDKSIEEVLLPDKQAIVPGEKLVKVYPNPNKGEFTIEFANIENGASVSIYNLLGVKVYQSTAMNQTSSKISMPGIKRGVYFVKVTDRNEQFTKKMIVN